VERVFIVLTNTDLWDDPPRARHQVAEAIAKRHKVYFVGANRTGFPSLRRESVQGNIEVLVPSYPVDYRIRYRVPCINRRYQSWLFKRLRRQTRHDNVTVINFDNTATEVFKYYGSVVYYCNDYNIRYYYLKLVKKYFEECERQIATRSLLCVGTARFLVERLRGFNANVLELRLGAPSAEGRLEFRRGGILKVGLVGYLGARRISMSIIEDLIDNEQVELYIYGRMEAGLAKYLKSRRNVKIRGVLRGRPLLDDFQQVHVGIAPYRIEDVNPGGTPNKLWLYLAAGKPVVISDLPSIREWVFPDRCVYRASSDSDFVRKVHQAYSEDTGELMMLRADFARQNSWDKRVEILLDRISVAERQRGLSQCGSTGDATAHRDGPAE
jgi:glycosyltransferase involved in cell wall biosynthesis